MTGLPARAFETGLGHPVVDALSAAPKQKRLWWEPNRQCNFSSLSCNLILPPRRPIQAAATTTPSTTVNPTIPRRPLSLSPDPVELVTRLSRPADVALPIPLLGTVRRHRPCPLSSRRSRPVPLPSPCTMSLSLRTSSSSPSSCHRERASLSSNSVVPTKLLLAGGSASQPPRHRIVMFHVVLNIFMFHVSNSWTLVGSLFSFLLWPTRLICCDKTSHSGVIIVSIMQCQLSM